MTVSEQGNKSAAASESRGPEILRSTTKAITVIHAVLTAVSVFVEGTLRAIISVSFVITFGIGLLVFLAAFFTAAARSRHDQVTVVGAFFLGNGAVDRSDQRLMFGAVAVQAVVAMAASTLRPFTAVAFSVLVPLLSLALAALLGARYGRFDPQKDPRAI